MINSCVNFIEKKYTVRCIVARGQGLYWPVYTNCGRKGGLPITPYRTAIAIFAPIPTYRQSSDWSANPEGEPGRLS